MCFLGRSDAPKESIVAIKGSAARRAASAAAAMTGETAAHQSTAIDLALSLWNARCSSRIRGRGCLRALLVHFLSIIGAYTTFAQTPSYYCRTYANGTSQCPICTQGTSCSVSYALYEDQEGGQTDRSGVRVCGGLHQSEGPLTQITSDHRTIQVRMTWTGVRGHGVDCKNTHASGTEVHITLLGVHVIGPAGGLGEAGVGKMGPGWRMRWAVA